MPKQAKFSVVKLKQICREYPDEFLATPTGDLQCILCGDVLIKCDKECFWKATEKVSNTKGNWRQKANPNASKLFYNSIKKNLKNRLSLYF